MAKELTKRKTLEELIAEDARSPIPTLQVQPDGSPASSAGLNPAKSTDEFNLNNYSVKLNFREPNHPQASDEAESNEVI